MTSTAFPMPGRGGRRTPAPGRWDVALERHVHEDPLYRAPILRAVAAFGASLPRGSHVLDAGAGNAPYRSLFTHCDYVTVDWPASVHDQASQADIVADLHRIPLADGAVDAVLATEVLEHVFDIEGVLHELYRVLRPGGRLQATVPFVIWEHESPYDFARYTSHALAHLLRQSGFVPSAALPLGGPYSAAAAALRHGVRRDLESAAPGHLTTIKWMIARTGFALAERAGPALDRRGDGPPTLPLGWAVEAQKPEGG